jgi:hypothetical protein
MISHEIEERLTRPMISKNDIALSESESSKESLSIEKPDN